MNILITGIGGFAGAHLAEYCLHMGAIVYGVCKTANRLEHIADHIKRAVTVIEGDLLSESAAQSAVQISQPDIVFHLAAQTSVPVSWQNPRGTLTDNIIAELNVLEALKDSHAKVHIASSSAIYGSQAGSVPLTEDYPPRPSSPYGVSKGAQELLALQYSQTTNLHIVCTRAFHHTGPGQQPQYALSSFAQQIAKIEKGLQNPTISTGNLKCRRDYCDIRDVVKAYWELMATSKTKSGEIYNICRGSSFSLQDILQNLLDMSSAKIKVTTHPALWRSNEAEIICGNPAKLKALIGWQPQIPWPQTLSDLLNYWREKIK
ncbi:MAG: GDP-mannose 4,6-dehydratase [Candidatus Bruticola sp.]